MSDTHAGVHGDTHGDEHIVPPRVYLAVFSILVVMTATTTAVSFVDLGPWNTVVALGIAFFKATLVALYFMHIKYAKGLDRVVMVGGLFWLAILLALTMGDFLTRPWLPIYQQFVP